MAHRLLISEAVIRVTHNGVEKTLDPASHRDLGEAISAFVRRDSAPPDMLLRVRVNGCDIPEPNVGALASFPLEGIAEIELESSAPADVARSCLENSRDYGERIAEAVGRTAQLLRSGEVEAANSVYAEALDGLGVWIHAIEVTTGTLGAEALSLGRLEEELGPWLERLVEAQEASDWVRVADYLEYEIRPLIDRFVREIERVLAVRKGAAIASD